MEDFTELNAWKECRKFRNEIRFIANKLPSEEKYMLYSQIKRSSRSITANIAEGYGRYHYQESMQYFRQARGSLKETKDHLIVALDENYISEERFNELMSNYINCDRLINGYINYLKRQKDKMK